MTTTTTNIARVDLREANAWPLRKLMTYKQLHQAEEWWRDYMFGPGQPDRDQDEWDAFYPILIGFQVDYEGLENNFRGFYNLYRGDFSVAPFNELVKQRDFAPSYCQSCHDMGDRSPHGLSDLSMDMTTIDLQEAVRVAKRVYIERSTTACMGLHARLGRSSPLARLDIDIVNLICEGLLE